MAGDGVGWEDELTRSRLSGTKAAEKASQDLGGAMDLEELASQCARSERSLRMQFPDWESRTFPPEWEAGLARPDRQATTMRGALVRWGYLWHLWRLETEDWVKRASRADAVDRNVIRDMATREPVQVVLPSRTIEVTGRSYSAMFAMARHWIRLRQIDAYVRRVRLHQSDLGQRLQENERQPMVQRRLRLALAREDRLLWEAMRHRKAIYAHATTSHGGAAESLDDAPDWWGFMTPEDDLALLLGLWRVGPERAGELREGQPQRTEGEQPDFGWHSLFASVEKEMKVEPASYYDRDIYQLEAWLALLPKPKGEDDVRERWKKSDSGGGWTREK